MATRDPDRDEATRGQRWKARRARQDRAARVAAGCFAVAILAAFALLVVYIAGGDTQIEGLLLFAAFGLIGAGLGLWVKRIIGKRVVVEQRYSMHSPADARDEFERAYEESLGEAVVGGRRRFLFRLLAGAGGALGLALLVPLRSLGPSPQGLFNTAWARGVRLIDVNEELIIADNIEADEVRTVFPEGFVDDAQAQAILVGTRPGRLDPGSLAQPTVGDIVVYSKICTHAGCPVGLYRARPGELLCPCHQSTFDVNAGAEVLSGPAGRPLPQLPIGVNEDGELIALGDFEEPVGPSFWNMYQEPTGA